MQEVGLQHVVASIEAALTKGDVPAAEGLLWPALDQFPEVGALWFFGGNVCYMTGRLALAATCFERAAELDSNAKVYANLAGCYRKLNRVDECRRVLARLLEREPENGSALTNMGASWVNEGNPWRGIPTLRKALQVGDKKAGWNLGILLLEAGEFAEGFDLYHQGVGTERLPKRYAADPKDEPPLLELGSPRAGKRLLVYGEQGIGDEIMFGCCLSEAMSEFGEVVFDCHPRLETLHQAAHPKLRTFPSRKEDQPDWFHVEPRFDYKAPVGDLAMLYRRSLDDYLSAASDRRWFYCAPKDERAAYRKSLEERAGGRKIVGLATRGGVISTNRHYRALGTEEIERIFAETEAYFVLLDYEDMTAFVEHIAGKFGERIAWFPAVTHAWDFHHTAALAAATDGNLTTCQSVAHISGAMRHPTRVLVPSRPAWRYGLYGRIWHLYPWPEVRLLRQSETETDGRPDWSGAVTEAIDWVNS